MPTTTERPVSTFAAYSARPTLRVDGQPAPALEAGIRTFSMTEAEGGMSSLALGLGNWGVVDGTVGLLFDAGTSPRLGSRIQLYAGDASGPNEIFDGRVHALEVTASTGEPPGLTLLAEDGLFKARMARRSQAYENVSVEDLARQVCARHALTLDASGLPGGTALWMQLNESDLAFLRRVLARSDCELQLIGSTLQIRSTADMDRGTLDLTLYSQLRELRVIADLSQQVSEVHAAGFDPADGSAFNASSTGVEPGPGTGVLAAALLAELGLDRREHLGALACRKQAEAQALADTAFDQRARQFVRVHGRTEGNASLRVGTRVNLHGAGRRFDNCYAVIEARHRFDAANGYVTEFVAQSAFLAEH